MNRIEQRYRLFCLVRLQRADEMQFDARVLPKQRWPFCLGLLYPILARTPVGLPIAGSIASAANVFETAISVTSAGSRPASRHARAISARTCSRFLTVAVAMRCLYRTVRAPPLQMKGRGRCFGNFSCRQCSRASADRLFQTSRSFQRMALVTNNRLSVLLV